MSEIPDRSTWPADLAETNPALYRNITSECPIDPNCTNPDHQEPIAAPELSIAERIVVAYFDAAEPAPESYRWVNQPGDDRQHRGEDCPCDPIDRGNGVVDHR